MDKLRLRAIQPPKVTQLSKSQSWHLNPVFLMQISGSLLQKRKGLPFSSLIMIFFLHLFLLEALEMTDVNYVLPWTQLWDQSILHNRSLPDWFIYFFHMGQELSFPLRWKERDFKTSSINAIMRKGNISEVGGTGRLHTLQPQPLPLLPFSRNIFYSQGQAIVSFEKNDILLW